ncbi:MAG: hypothetical protein LBO09_00080 [Candidatus Peribacteria bacterium]|jgi:hypothetical protein|nr:hypothetical protein [Candidatus Peribacteria bacterium]
MKKISILSLLVLAISVLTFSAFKENQEEEIILYNTLEIEETTDTSDTSNLDTETTLPEEGEANIG